MNESAAPAAGGWRARARLLPGVHTTSVRVRHAAERALGAAQIAVLRWGPAPPSCTHAAADAAGSAVRPGPGTGDPELVVSLTSFPARIHRTWIPIARILHGDRVPDRIVLVLAEPEFPGRRLPDELHQLEDRGLEILWTDRNTCSYKKLGPTRLAHPDATIITIDDDAMYAPWTVSRLVEESHRHPGAVVGHRGWQVEVDDDGPTDYLTWSAAGPTTAPQRVLLTGVGGILYPPDVLPVDLLTDLDAALSLAPTGDDLWAWGVERAADVPVHCTGLSSFRPLRCLGNDPRLFDVNGAHGNQQQLGAVMDHLGIHLAVEDRSQAG